jgi:hypothetical protein
VRVPWRVWQKNPHPNPLPGYREREQEGCRIAAILLLQPQLDANYQRTKSAAFDWAQFADGPTPNPAPEG